MLQACVEVLLCTLQLGNAVIVTIINSSVNHRLIPHAGRSSTEFVRGNGFGLFVFCFVFLSSSVLLLLLLLCGILYVIRFSV